MLLLRAPASVRMPALSFPPPAPPKFARAAALGAVALGVALACAGDAREARPAGSARTPSNEAPALVDDFGDTVLARPAARVVSLNPTTTELVYPLGAGPRLVGRSRWDTSPDSALAVPEVGDGLRPNVEAVLARRPDLVLLYASADNRAAAAAFRRAGVATIALKIDRVADFARGVRLVATALGDTARGRQVSDSVLVTIERVRRATRSSPRPTVFWQLWDRPLMAVGSGSFLAELLDAAGARTAYADVAQPSPVVALEDVLRRDPDVVLAGAARAQALRGSRAWAASKALRTGRILVLDSSVVEVPSVRMGQSAVALARLLHPELRF